MFLNMTILFKLKKIHGLLCSFYFFKNFLKYGVAASVENKKLIKNINFDCLIDVGANIGQFSTLCYEIKPNLYIYSFEPIRVCFDKLNNVLSESDNIFLENVALGDVNEKKIINISKRIDSSSILDFELQDKVFKNTTQQSKELINVKKLDDYINTIKGEHILLKIDVQGYEKNVLLGGINLLKKVRYIFIELSFIELYKNQPLFYDIYNLLINRGFILKSINNLTYENSFCIQGDFLFENGKNL